MGRRRAGVTQVVGCGGQTVAKMMLPDPVDQHPRQQGRRARAGLRQPSCEGQPPAGRGRAGPRWIRLIAIIGIGQEGRDRGADLGTGCGGVASDQDRSAVRITRHIADPGDPPRVGLSTVVESLDPWLERFLLLLPDRFWTIGERSLQRGDLGVDRLIVRFPSREFVERAGDHDPLVWIDPVLDVERRVKDRLELVVFLLRDRLELVVVAFGALERQAQQRRADDLDRALEHVVLVDADLVRIAVALAGAILGVAQEVSGDQLIDRLGWRTRAATIAGQLVAGQLLADDLIQRPVGVERADDVIAISVGQRPVGIGAEVPVGIGVSRGVEPVLPPPLAVSGRGQQAVDQAFVGVQGRVMHELRDRLGLRRQAGQVEAEAADHGRAIGVGAEGQPALFERPLNEAIDRGADGIFGLGPWAESGDPARRTPSGRPPVRSGRPMRRRADPQPRPRSSGGGPPSPFLTAAPPASGASRRSRPGPRARSRPGCPAPRPPRSHRPGPSIAGCSG